MRKILFKAKRKDNGEWVEGYYRADPDLDKHFICGWDYYTSENGLEREPFEYEINPGTLCQYTGLTDKNGKKIWEGDIVDGHQKRGAGFYRCLVLWNECKARFDVRTMDYNFPMTLDECSDDISMGGLDYKVIGDIFDNTELLEV